MAANDGRRNPKADPNPAIIRTLNPQPSTLDRLLWLLLPACASVLLLATTNKMCQEVAVIPFLWVLPLALYLLSFIICFDSPRWYVRLPVHPGAHGGMGRHLLGAVQRNRRPPSTAIERLFRGPFHLLHGLSRRTVPAQARPAASDRILSDDCRRRRAGRAVCRDHRAVDFHRLFRIAMGTSALRLLLLLVWSCATGNHGPLPDRWRLAGIAPGCWHGPGQRSVSLLWRQAHRLGTSNDLQVAELLRRADGVSAKQWRTGLRSLSFCMGHRARAAIRRPGASRLADDLLRREERRRSGHARARRPATGASGWSASAPARWPLTLKPEITSTFMKSTRTCCGWPIRGSPISPIVRGKVEVTLGDARLSLEREPPQNFDLLVLDAFNSDAIPVHLLTEEAFTIYERHLKTNGIIAVHISNRNLNLEPVVANLARHFNYKAVIIDYDPPPDQWWIWRSVWMLLSHNGEIIDSPAIRLAARPAQTNSVNIPLWTDDFASLFQILRSEPPEIDPGFSEAQTRIAASLCQQGNFAGAIARYRRALQIHPDLPDLLNNLAWLLATCPDASLRNGPQAVRHAENACELTHYQRTPWWAPWRRPMPRPDGLTMPFRWRRKPARWRPNRATRIC